MLDFFKRSPQSAANCLQYILLLKWTGAIVCKSRATHRALIVYTMSCAVWCEGTAQLSSLTELKSHLVLFVSSPRWLKTLTDEVGEESRVPEKKKKKKTASLA